MAGVWREGKPEWCNLQPATQGDIPDVSTFNLSLMLSAAPTLVISSIFGNSSVGGEGQANLLTHYQININWDESLKSSYESNYNAFLSVVTKNNIDKNSFTPGTISGFAGVGLNLGWGFHENIKEAYRNWSGPGVEMNGGWLLNTYSAAVSEESPEGNRWHSFTLPAPFSYGVGAGLNIIETNTENYYRYKGESNHFFPIEVYKRAQKFGEQIEEWYYDRRGVSYF